MSDYEYDEAVAESDFDSAFEDLEYDEARRRRRRRGRGRRDRGGRRPSRVIVPPPPRRELDASRQRDRQLARAINTTNEEVSDVETRLAKVNSDVSRLRQLALISLILPQAVNVTRQRLTLGGSPPGTVIETTTDPNRPGVDVATAVAPRTDILPLIIFMMMSRGIGTPARGGSAMGGDSTMMLLLVLVLMQQQPQGQAGGQALGQTAAGGLDTSTLLLLLVAMGGLS